jgi:hypothetical protein
MLIFLDETFRKSARGHEFGAVCGIGIPEDAFGKIAADIFSMKWNSFGDQFAKERELKGAELLKNRNFDRPELPSSKAYVSFVYDLTRYIVRQKLATFGVICFDPRFRSFRCDDPHRLDVTFRALFERIDGYMRNEFPARRAKLVFDDVDYGTNRTRAEGITNFFNRTSIGRGYDTIIRTPFFAVSQAQNIGLQLADVVTSIYGMRFQGRREVDPFFRELKKSLYRFQVGSRTVNTMRVFKDWSLAES